MPREIYRAVPVKSYVIMKKLVNNKLFFHTKHYLKNIAHPKEDILKGIYKSLNDKRVFCTLKVGLYLVYIYSPAQKL